ncbi:OmpH family outer membrane protein [Enterobacter ludwigii]|uniref:OmpH family outer membrane protein n=1 Tax=Enterobacter ludwigii TaxID=299767 RepID=UPI003F721806
MKENIARFFKLYIFTVVIIGIIVAWCVVNFKRQDLVYVNTAQVLSASSLHTQAQERMNKVMALLQKAEQEASLQYQSMSEDDARETKIVDQQLLHRLLEESRQSTRHAVLLEINNAVKKVIARENYPVAVDATLVLANDSNYDITDKIVKELATTKVNFGPMPEINVGNSGDQ